MCSKTDLEPLSDVELLGVLRVWRAVARERWGLVRTARYLWFAIVGR